MIEVIFAIHARGKVSTGGGSLEAIPLMGQIITIRHKEYKVLHVSKTYPGTTQKLPKPEIDVEPVN
jgi:hypothetical protein